KTADASRAITIDIDAPDADGGKVVGSEDAPVNLGWQDLHISAGDVDHIVIDSIPAKGVLEYKDLDGTWKTVTQGQAFTAEQVDLGLRFTPNGNEAGTGYADIR